MEVVVVKNQIKNKQLDKFYIFTGDEWEVQRVYVDKIIECGAFQRKSVDTIAEVFSKLKSKSILSKPTCYVIRDDAEFLKNETAWQSVEDALDENIIILELSDIDKRSKFYKHYKDKIVDFERLSDDMLITYIQRKIDLSERNCKRLIDICERDYGRILLEIDKIRRYVSTDRPLFGHGKNSTEEDCCFEMLVKDGTIYQPAKDALFDFVDAVMKRRTNEAFELYQQCERKGIAVMIILTVLYANVKQVLQVQDCMRESANIAKTTGLSSYQIKLAKEKVGRYSIGELVYMLQSIRAIEIGIKVGKVDEKTAIPELLVKVL